MVLRSKKARVTGKRRRSYFFLSRFTQRKRVPAPSRSPLPTTTSPRVVASAFSSRAGVCALLPWWCPACCLPSSPCLLAQAPVLAKTRLLIVSALDIGRRFSGATNNNNNKEKNAHSAWVFRGELTTIIREEMTVGRALPYP